MQRARSTQLEACSNGGATSEKAALLAAEDSLVKPSASEDPELLAAQASAALEASRRAFACRVVSGGLGLLFIVLLACQGLNSASSPDEARSFSSRCLSSSGGGVVGPRGSLLHFSPSCTVELREYFDGAYFAEVRRVADDAIAYFRALVARQNRQDQLAGAAGPRTNRGTVVFDIDETALSNLDSFFSRTAPWSRLLGGLLGGGAGLGGAGMGDGDCVYPHLEYMPFAGAPASPPLVLMAGKGAGGAAAGDGGAGVGVGGGAGAGAGGRPLLRLCSSPPLRATLDLYTYLAANNFTLVFLTGRSEDARAQTAANLEEAGYGSLCPAPSAAAAAANGAAAAVTTAVDALSLSEVFDAATAPSRSSSAGSGAAGGPLRHRRHLAQQGHSDQAGASPADAAAAVSTSARGSGLAAPCYAALLMRRVGDERLASVFKAEARAALAGGGGGGGHVIAGNIGDQYSDLVGEAAGAASFKLPNPVYTLL
ncbi:hypothetical protein HYH02_003864 [Chlamydomonas schloesseri]|uniref:Acid phosphatase n=1 Tax=Chlamydomonas schloesseri TaxID=2026947 RepID=A0A835WP42_9CHLO|nr:hypothetical protein HYH02_003864 [Chlamydomonas schloesseri]|eukprot:KAG2451257.1 hypothetical protein HYH02_003864 [Chlamydomonas schloesseri]